MSDQEGEPAIPEKIPDSRRKRGATATVHHQVITPDPVSAVFRVPDVQIVRVPVEVARAAVEDADKNQDPFVEVLVRSMVQDIGLRKVFAYGSIVLFATMNVGAIVLCFFNGFGLTALSDTALIALLSATVAEVAGVMLIVATYLFPKQPGTYWEPPRESDAQE